MNDARYTPTTDEARNYFLGGYTESGAGSCDESDAAFDRFIDRVREDARADALARLKAERV